MTNKSKQPASLPQKPSKVGQWQFKGYVNVTLRKSEADVMKEWAAARSADECLDAVLKLADSGYKVSVGEGSQGMVATLSNYDGPAETRGYILSARAGSAHNALLKLLYLHREHLDCDWSVAIEASSADEW